MLIKKQLIVGFLFKFSVFTHMLIKKTVNTNIETVPYISNYIDHMLVSHTKQIIYNTQKSFRSSSRPVPN